MTTVPARLPVAEAVIGLLANGTPLPVGYAEAPRDAAPYYVLFPGTMLTDGPLGDGSADADTGFQVTTVGVGGAQVDDYADMARAVLTGARLTVDGRHCDPITHELTRPAQRDDDKSPPLFYAIDQYRIPTSPV